MTIAPLPVPDLFGMDEPPVEIPPASERRAAKPGLGRLPELALCMALGSAAIAVAFAGARYGHPWADHLFWAGEIVIFAVPASFLVFRTRVSSIEAMGVALLMPATTFLVNQYYSPGQFRFSDEFDHVQTAQTILATHHLFHTNTILPQSAQYPGLEIITTGIVSITHLSITTSGLIVAGTAHVLAGLALYFLVLETIGRPRPAALATVVYATGSHYQFFDSYFIYETIALPFLLLALLATVKMMKQSGRAVWGWAAVAMASGIATAVCHHVTSYVLVAMLFAFVVAQLLLPRESRSPGVIPLFLAVIAAVAVWDLGVATSTVSYFRPVVNGLFPGHSSARPPTGGAVIPRNPGISGKPPRVDTIAEYVGFLLLLALTGIGAWKVWRVRRSAVTGAALGLAIASLSILVTLALRGTTNGSELAGRSLTFVLIPVSFVASLALVGGATKQRATPWKGRLAAGGCALAVVVLAVGGIASGWPPPYARLPGPYLASAWERSVDEHNLSLGEWFATYMPKDQGVASDFSTESIISALGYQAEVTGIAGLFLPERFVASQGALARSKRVSFIAVDKRVAEDLPQTGYYFKDDPESGHYTEPLSIASITKFGSIPGVSRIYDDGTIVVYEIIGSAYSR